MDGSDEAHHGSQGEVDDGSYKHDWVAQKQIENCKELEEEFWARHGDLDRDANIELALGPKPSRLQNLLTPMLAWNQMSQLL